MNISKNKMNEYVVGDGSLSLFEYFGAFPQLPALDLLLHFGEGGTALLLLGDIVHQADPNNAAGYDC
jgi:hypothetical protein